MSRGLRRPRLELNSKQFQANDEVAASTLDNEVCCTIVTLIKSEIQTLFAIKCRKINQDHLNYTSAVADRKAAKRCECYKTELARN